MIFSRWIVTTWRIKSYIFWTCSEDWIAFDSHINERVMVPASFINVSFYTEALFVLTQSYRFPANIYAICTFYFFTISNAILSRRTLFYKSILFLEKIKIIIGSWRKKTFSLTFLQHYFYQLEITRKCVEKSISKDQHHARARRR